MDFHSPLKRSFHFLCFFLASSFFLRSHHVSSDPKIFQNCKNNFSCGNITGIGYPFRHQDDPEYCGYPGLELRCYESNGDHITRIEIKNMTFRVLGIDPPTQTMRIAREDVMDATCPTDLVNTTLDFSLFDYANSMINLTFLYGCPDSSFPGLNLNVLPPCGARVYVLPGVVGPGRCNASVIYPVVQTGNGGSVNYTSLDQVLRDGFDIRWRVDSSMCAECSGSHGKCGYQLDTHRTNCYCPNPPYVDPIACSVSSSSRGLELQNANLILGLPRDKTIWYVVNGKDTLVILDYHSNKMMGKACFRPRILGDRGSPISRSILTFSMPYFVRHDEKFTSQLREERAF